MGTTENPNPQTPAREPELSIEQQLDKLLVQIEEQEPGTIEQDVLPQSLRQQQQQAAQDKASNEPAGKQSDEVADALAQFENAMQPAEPASEPEVPVPAAEVTDEPAPAQEEHPEPDMLAALNAALKDLDPDSTTKFGPPKEQPAPLPDDALAVESAAPEVETEAEPIAQAEPEAAAAAPTGDTLTNEINALLNAQAETKASDASEALTEAATPITAEPAAATEAPRAAGGVAEAQEQDSATQERIAAEIEDLLNTSQALAEGDASPTIDDIDQMLADEIDLDDELSGDFQSVQEITAGIQVDDHTASASDVAAELDSQPESQPAPPAPAVEPEPEPAEDPFALLAAIANKAEKNEVEHRKKMSRAQLWQKLVNRFGFLKKINPDTIRTAGERLLKACYLLNWPARRFLTSEWRANLGYLALIHLFAGVAVWLYLIVR